jgi:hypothetical protein
MANTVKTTGKPRGRPRKLQSADATPAKRSANTVLPIQVDEPSPFPSEGARLLASLRGTVQLIADSIGATKQAASAWRIGIRVPEEQWRRKLHEVHGIPIVAWDRPPQSTSENEKPPAAAPAPAPWFPENTGAEPSALEDCVRLLGLLRSQLNRPDLLGRERVQLGDAFARALTQKERLERAREMLEARTIKEHPEWRRLKRLVIDALLPFPAASKAVEAAILRVLGEENDDGGHP